MADSKDSPPNLEEESPLAAISDDDFVIRKIPSTPHFQDTPEGQRRVSKSAFSASSAAVDPEEGMSTSSEQLLQEAGVDLALFAPEYPALAKLHVKAIRDLGLTVEHQPTDDDPAHCQVLGVKDKHRKKLLRLAIPIRSPEGLIWKP